MILSAPELESLVRLEHLCPHQLLGLHPLGDKKGLVARAFAPGAKSVTLVPVHDKSKPSFSLKPLDHTGYFEGTTRKASEIYAYDLCVAWPDGTVEQGRDPYSFLPTLGELDLHLFGEGNDRSIHDKLGAHLRVIDGVPGTSFAVWAPNARRISVIGSFNNWDGRKHPMRLLGASGVWEIFIPGAGEGALYKFEIWDKNGDLRQKTDPFGAFFELAPKQAAIVWDTRKHHWSDDAWIKRRAESNPLKGPMSIYELHLGSWIKKSQGESPGYREVAPLLVDYLHKTGFTHVEFMPLAEHAFYPSWGYQVTGFFAPTSRYGTPDDLQFLINALHEAGIGVFMDWVPAHFPRDDWALANFDGTALYEHEDPRQGAHQDWGTLIFNFGRNEVRNFLAANALYWCERFHLDGLRVDAVASMLYLDYSRNAGEWVPNKYGGRENIEAVEFLRYTNDLVHTIHPGTVMIAEESTAWPMVSKPPYIGGLGFSLKWNMGWMHDTLNYFKNEPVHRKYHQNDLTFAMLYHYQENFVLPLSHDEVVHGKRSLLGRMPGDDWQRFANLRTLLGYQWMFPGKKLLFMGCEIGQSGEWNHNASVDWRLLEAGPYHKGCQQWVEDLNRFYSAEPALWELDFDPAGFWWLDCSDAENSILSFCRQTRDGSRQLIVILNLTPVPRGPYRIGLPRGGQWKEVLNSDSSAYGGSNVGNKGGVTAEAVSSHGQSHSALFTLPPLSVIVLAAI
jgi:1,4-alpha-glucan branching enzyme